MIVPTPLPEFSPHLSMETAMSDATKLVWTITENATLAVEKCDMKNNPLESMELNVGLLKEALLEDIEEGLPTILSDWALLVSNLSDMASELSETMAGAYVQ